MRSFFVSLLLAAIAAAPALAQSKPDMKGSSDHPLVGRYQGSVIAFHQVKGYEELSLPDRPLGRGDTKNVAAWQTELAGRLTSIRYEGPAERSALEVLRNFEASLKSKGFEIVLFCRGEKECAPGGMSTFWNVARGGIGLLASWGSSAYLLARRDSAEGVVTVGIIGVETTARPGHPLTPHVAVTVVEGKPMETDKIALVQASEMQQALVRDGRVAIYGIHFDFDRADIRPESKDQIDQLAALLKENPKLEVIVVGHTDGKGAFDYNLTLSQRRAQAVADALVGQYGIARARITPAGAGMVAPVASNRTEQGQARNRRVEIVERYTGR